MNVPSPLARLLPVVAALATAVPATAGVKLITLPARERVEIQLDHAAATLVEEERVVPLAAGVNDVVFAWANTNIDPGTIQLRCLTDPDEIKILSVSYPPNENALTWQVASPRAGSARMRISYIIGRLDKTFAYRATASRDEKTLSLRQFIHLHNRANERFGVAGMWAGFGQRLERPIEVNETKRLLSARFDDVPVTKTYTADLAGFGYLDEGKKQLRIPMHYVLRNDAAGGLGRFALMPGKARIFQDDGRGTVAFLGEDWAPFTPREDEVKLFLGVSKDIVVTRTIERRERERVMGQLHEYDVIVKYEIENFKDQPVTLDLAESMPALRAEIHGHTGRAVEWTLGNRGTVGAADPEDSTADRPVFHVTLPPRGDDEQAVKVIHRLHVHIKNEW
jgi:hypothetical protein